MLGTTLRFSLARAHGQFGVRIFDSLGYGHALRDVLEETGSMEKRSCPLRAAVVATLVVALGLYRHLSIPAVFRELLYWFRREFDDLGLRPVTDEALLHAKRRLGLEPMATLFDRLAQQVKVRASFHGLRVHGIDGVRFSVADTSANEARFGRWRSSNGDRTAFPQVQAVLRVDTEAHQLTKVCFQRCDRRDLDAIPELIEGLGSSDLVLLDRGFHALWLFEMCLQRGLHFLCRSTTLYKPRILRRLGHGDYLVLVSGRVPLPADQAVPHVRTHRKVTIVLRMIEYRIGRRQRVRLLTDLTDPDMYPAIELARLYHARWECELAYDEIKTHLAAPPAGTTTELSFRSRSPDDVLQEAYGLFIAFNLVRALMIQAAESIDAQTREISFTGALHVIRMLLPDLQAATASEYASLLQELYEQLRSLRLRRLRRPRRYPRVVRVKIIRFPRKRYWHRQHRVDMRRRLALVNIRSQSLAAA